MLYSDERRLVLEAAREILANRMVIGTWGNVSMRIGGQDLAVITPSGMDYQTLTPHDMVLVNLDGQVIEGKYRPSIETPMHTALYRSRPDAGALVHVHSPYAAAFAVAGQPIPVILEETAQVIGHAIKAAPYAACGSNQLAASVVEAMGEHGKAVLLAMHGLIGLGRNLEDALKVCYIAEKTAMVALLARQLGPLPSLSDEEIEVLRQGFRAYRQEKKSKITLGRECE